MVGCYSLSSRKWASYQIVATHLIKFSWWKAYWLEKMAWHTCNVVLSYPAAIGNAFAVLSNPEKRLRYDQFGDEQETFCTPRAKNYDYYREFEADITPEEIFNMFFGGQFPTGSVLSIVSLKCEELESWLYLILLKNLALLFRTVKLYH